jgi:hypothetical protein
VLVVVVVVVVVVVLALVAVAVLAILKARHLQKVFAPILRLKPFNTVLTAVHCKVGLTILPHIS